MGKLITPPISEIIYEVGRLSEFVSKCSGRYQSNSTWDARLPSRVPVKITSLQPARIDRRWGFERLSAKAASPRFPYPASSRMIAHQLQPRVPRIEATPYMRSRPRQCHQRLITINVSTIDFQAMLIDTSETGAGRHGRISGQKDTKP